MIKPDGMSKGLIGTIIDRFLISGFDLKAIRLVTPTKDLVEEHYQHIQGTQFYEGVVSFLMGAYHPSKKVLALVIEGENGIAQARKIAGATNPEEAEYTTIRGAYGRITSKGIFENVIHVSSSQEDAQREISLWFN
ncbi:MAG: nucleoside-diphosphate kinase [Candidatus Omnitrophica bacterium]|nr:nucleoside-diphosphate kinase [Candidatus Omnitrophota bacterium]